MLQTEEIKELGNILMDFQNSTFYKLILLPIGTVLWEILKYLWQKFICSKLTDYTLVYAMNMSPKKLQLGRYRRYIIQVLKGIGVLQVIYITICCGIIFLPFSGGEEYRNPIMLILILYGMCIVSYILKYINKKEMIQEIMCCILGAIIGIFILTQISFFYRNYFVWLSLFCIALLILLEYILIRNGFYKDYQNKYSIIARTVGYIAIIVEIYLFFNHKRYGIDGKKCMILTIVWMVICIIEYFIIIYKDKRFIIPVEIHIGKDVFVTKQKVLQYKNNKVKFTTEDGMVYIFDREKISSIRYILIDDYWIKRRNRTAICKLKNGCMLKVDGYRFAKKEWIYLHKYSGIKKQVVIVDSKQVDSIEQAQIKRRLF